MREKKTPEVFRKANMLITTDDLFVIADFILVIFVLIFVACCGFFSYNIYSYIDELAVSKTVQEANSGSRATAAP